MTEPHVSGTRPALESLTGLRFVAAMAVVLYHVLESFAPRSEGWLSRLAAHGYLGVSLFFVLSGFILTYTYIDVHTGTLRGTMRSFWWARVARIYPVYLATLALALPVFVLYRIVLASEAARPHAIIAAVLAPALLQSWWPRAACQWNCPGWSLSVELFFYLLFPVMAVWLARRRPRGPAYLLTAWAGCVAAPLAYLAMQPAGAPPPTSFDLDFLLLAVKFNPVAHLGEFVIGVVAALAWLRRTPASMLTSAAMAWSVGAALGVVSVVLAATDALPYLLLHNGLLAPLWAGVIIVLASGRGTIGRWLASGTCVRLGEASYALYLLHAPLLGYVVLVRGLLRIRHPQLSLPGWLQVAGYLALAVGLSLWLFQRLEEPARHRIRAWGQRR